MRVVVFYHPGMGERVCQIDIPAIKNHVDIDSRVLGQNQGRARRRKPNSACMGFMWISPSDKVRLPAPEGRWSPCVSRAL